MEPHGSWERTLFSVLEVWRLPNSLHKGIALWLGFSLTVELQLLPEEARALSHRMRAQAG
jgi:hypothetical protein